MPFNTVKVAARNRMCSTPFVLHFYYQIIVNVICLFVFNDEVLAVVRFPSLFLNIPIDCALGFSFQLAIVCIK